ncbi:hypothetical protein J1G42_11860 [Cellulomonas sp. zg-ZUI222]|uniref:hypothetical protein n=1 Tax=Cellulomonas TaxID=1707 RepID=UPI001A949DBB|nr:MULTISPECIES: hypothetical protein [Cellulomonas]MBO0900865.1 hypothetical protein [Cellulomonas sp. zg-ZUI22]MBO0921520.1 hypothetical protein [Cellulomonas wangleii]
MGRHDGRRSAPPTPWYRRAALTALRWLGRLALGALAGGVVLGATLWAGTSWQSARLLGAAAGVLVVVAAALAATLPGPAPSVAPPSPTRPGDPSPPRDAPRSDR